MFPPSQFKEDAWGGDVKQHPCEMFISDQVYRTLDLRFRAGMVVNRLGF